MACEKPGDGDCTQINTCGGGSGCGGCGGCGEADLPVLPRCQDVQLTPGSYTNATITVNAQGCISAVATGNPPVYTPDDCCGDGSGGGGGSADCATVVECLASAPLAGTATGTTVLIGRDGKGYTVAASGGETDCAAVKDCIANFPSGATVTTGLKFVGADGKLYTIEAIAAKIASINGSGGGGSTTAKLSPSTFGPISALTGSAITPTSAITATGFTGTVTYSISPTLPPGLSISSSSGVISGTPTATAASASYTITGTDGTSSATATGTIQVLAGGSTRFLSPAQFESILAIEGNEIVSTSGFTAIGFSGPVVYTISPTLPQGLAINSSTGVISGTPSMTSSGPQQTYTVTATYNTETATATGTIQVQNQPELEINTPQITSPAAGAPVQEGFTITSSAFATSYGSDTHASSDWQIATDSGFSNIVVQSIASTTNKISWTPQGLSAGTQYYVRVKHNGASGTVSAWSTTIQFSTAVPTFDWTVFSSGYSNLTDILYDGSDFYITTFSGEMYKSPTGDFFTPHTTNLPTDLSYVYKIGRVAGLYVTAGVKSNGFAAIYTSSDAVTWTEYNTYNSKRVYGIAAGNGYGIAVGTQGLLLTTTDGVTWTEQVSGTALTLWDAGFIGSTFIVVGESGLIATSPNATSWTVQTSNTYEPLFDVASANGVAVAVGANATVLRSTDNGVSWTSISNPAAGPLTNIMYENGRWIASGTDIIVSTDAITWQKETSNKSGAVQGATYGEGAYLAVTSTQILESQ